MTGPEHFVEAERLLSLIYEQETTPAGRLELLAEAQVHATLAKDAATATQTSVAALPAATTTIRLHRNPLTRLADHIDTVLGRRTGWFPRQQNRSAA